MTKQQGGGGVCSSCNDPNFATVTVNRGGAVVCAECGKVFFSPAGAGGHVSPPADHECSSCSDRHCQAVKIEDNGVVECAECGRSFSSVEFGPGDIVVLKSGGPEMAVRYQVDAVASSNTGEIIGVHTIWFVGDVEMGGVFPPESLKRVKEGER